MSDVTNDELIPGIEKIVPIRAPLAVNGAEPNCATCRHSFEMPNAPKGQLLCRRNPPVAGVMMVPVPVNPRLVHGKMTQDMGMAPKVFTVFPEVTDKILCGAHEPRARLPLIGESLDRRGPGGDPT